MKKRIFLSIVLSLSHCMSYANSIDFLLSGGAAFSRLSNSTSVQMNNDVINNYDVHKETDSNLLEGIGIGYHIEKINHQPIDISLALMGYHVNFHHIKGTEYPFVNSGDFDTLDFRYKTDVFATLLESRFIYSQCNWQPIILLGLGTSWNRLYDFRENPTNAESSAVAAPASFGSNTETSLAYEIGVGVQYVLSANNKNQINWLLSLDYRYINFGRGEFSRSPAQTINDPLKIENINTQALFFSIIGSI